MFGRLSLMTNTAAAATTPTVTKVPEHGRDIIVHTTAGKEFCGWRHEVKEHEGPEGFLALMIGRRKNPTLIPWDQVAWWGYNWR